MKLIFILNHYAHNSSSHFYHILNLLEEIAKYNVEIALVIEKCENIPEIRNPSIKVINQKSNSRFIRPLELAIILFKLTKQGYNHAFIRISWVAAIVAIMVSFFFNLKTYYWLSGQGGFEIYKNLSLGKEKIKFFVAFKLPFLFIKTFATKFVTGPESMKAYFIEIGKVSADKILVLYNDIDTNRFKILDQDSKEALKLKLGFNKDEKIIFFSHRFSPVRRTLYYLPYIYEKLYASIKENYVIVMAGSGPEEKELKSEIYRSFINEKIKMLGNIPNASIQEYYQIADIYINPTYAEGFPRVLIEAMASGLPIVTTNAGGIKDIIGVKQSLYMVDKNDRDAFAERLITLCKNENEREMLIAENLEEVKRFSTENVAKMYISKIFNF